MTATAKNRPHRYLFIPLLLILLLILFSGTLLRKLGNLIVLEEPLARSDAVVVLTTGIEYYPRLMQAADVYRQGLVNNVVINGNRKTDTFRQLETMGFERCCAWYADSIRILTMLNVPENKIIWISAEDAYDSVSEAEIVGKVLIEQNLRNVIITTSKFHSRRAKYIWKKMYENRLSISVVPAKADPYNPDNWWKDGKQIRWVLAEYGAWIYYFWKEIAGI